tara:strand:- start:10045 stop:10485 length:441 start_codon:yes stop_codon:yes gene_type:complete
MTQGMTALGSFMFNKQNADDSLQFNLARQGEGYRISRNFKLREAQSRCGADIIYIHPATLVLAQTLRDEFGPIQINSWFRTVYHNSTVGGSENSKHLLGMAIDVDPKNASLEEIKAYAEILNVGGIGLYEEFVHLDTYGENRRWRG